MGKIFATLVLSLYGIFLINLIWVLTNMYYFATDGFQTLFVATTLVENVYFSVYLKWILLLDFSYVISVLIFMATRKNYKTDSKLHNLAYDPIKNPKICVTMHTYNEEQVIEKAVKDFVKQDNVEKETEKIYTLFNPCIMNYSKETVVMEEGCLSLPKQFADIERPQSITVRYMNGSNKAIEERKDGLEARILQHEIDHLSGKLFIDYLSSLKRNMLIKKVQKLKKMGV